MKHYLLFVIASICAPLPLSAADAPKSANPDRQVQPGVPQGKVTAGVFTDSQIFPGTRRDYSVYVPAQYTADKPASLMVFMDGSGYSKANGAFRVPVVFDNLIQQQAMPVTIAVFVNPGSIPATKPGAKDRSNRSFEYDSMGDRYAQFLVDEFLPVALNGLNVSTDPQRAGRLRHFVRRYLRIYRRMGAARPVRQSAEPHRQLHQYPRRLGLSGPCSKDQRPHRSRSRFTFRTARTI